jgi:hypothetical protein
MKISDNTNIGLPLRNLLMLVSSIVVGAWFAFGVIERLNRLETKNQLFEKDLLEAKRLVFKNQLIQEQFMILEWQATQIEKMQKMLEANVHTGVMLSSHEKEIEKLKKDIEKLKDATRDIKFANGNGSH